MVVIDWLQTTEFIRQNSERFILYSLCGCFIGIAIILITVIVILYLEKQRKINRENSSKNNYQTPRTDFDYNDILSNTRSYLPIYRYDGRTHNGLYNV